MAYNLPEQPDLASILRTLSTYTTQTPDSAYGHPTYPITPAHVPATTAHDRYEDQPTINPQENEDEYDPSAPYLLATTPNQQLAVPQSSVKQQQALLEDPRTITKWSSALRYVTKHVSQHEEIVARVRHLITSQHAHEKQWWGNREALVKVQEERVEGQRKVNEVLYVVAVDSGPDKANSTQLTTY